ncbi:MAG: 50S ribosomal protein L9 [Patescibacteria group bacterium]
MKVILLKDIKGVGKRFDEKNVADGYALNFLLPNNFALIADKAGLAKIKQLKEASEANKAEEAKKLGEKEAKRLTKHLELEKFRRNQSEIKD